jgi:hypothetical protein
MFFIYLKTDYKRQASQVIPILYVVFGADCIDAACLKNHSDSCMERFHNAHEIHV